MKIQEADYKIVAEETSEELENEVKKYLKKGYTCQGGVFYHLASVGNMYSTTFLQAMYRPYDWSLEEGDFDGAITG